MVYPGKLLLVAGVEEFHKIDCQERIYTRQINFDVSLQGIHP